jgi:hypothetical protein
VTVALEERGEARRHAQGDVLDATRLAAVDAEAAVDATASFLGAVAEDLAARPGVEHCKRLLGLIPRATDWYSSVGVARPDGRVYCGTTAEPRHLHVEHAHIRVHVADLLERRHTVLGLPDQLQLRTASDRVHEPGSVERMVIISAPTTRRHSLDRGSAIGGWEDLHVRPSGR